MHAHLHARWLRAQGLRLFLFQAEAERLARAEEEGNGAAGYKHVVSLQVGGTVEHEQDLSPGRRSPGLPRRRSQPDAPPRGPPVGTYISYQ